MNTAIVYVLASVGEIAGCFSFWAWLRLGKSPLWLLPGMASLALFAYLLTRIDTATAGRAYAAYGSVYIVSSICWLWAIAGVDVMASCRSFRASTSNVSAARKTTTTPSSFAT